MSNTPKRAYKPLEDILKEYELLKLLTFLRELFEGGCHAGIDKTDKHLTIIALSQKTVEITRDCTITQLPATGDYTIEVRRSAVSFSDYVKAMEEERKGLTAAQQNDGTFVSPVALKILGTPRLMQLDCKSECIVWLKHQFSKLTPISDAQKEQTGSENEAENF